MDVLWGGVGGSKRKRPHDVVGEKIDMFVAPTGGGGSSIVKVPGDVPPARVYFFGLLV